MPRITDQRFLRQNQYACLGNLTARSSVHERFSCNPQNWHVWVFDRLELAGVQQVLELGCGAGNLWLPNVTRIGSVDHLCLSDFSMGMVAGCRARLRNDPRFSFIQCDAQRIPLPDGTCDRVVANHMLYHLPDIARGLAEIYRVLKPGGLLLAATNGRCHLTELHELVRQVDPTFPAGSDANDRFGLENGPEQLRAFFQEVQVEEFKDALWVTEAEPLVSYVCSMWDAPEQEAVITQMRAFFQAKIVADGGIYIQKSSGLIKARKNGGSCV